MKHAFLYLLALHTALSIKPTIKLKRKLIIPKLEDCKKLKCPTVEEPICVKIKNKKLENTTNTIYIVMLNKCEMGYMKCHKGLEAYIVPMKNCAHGDQTKSGYKKLKRSKRDIKGGGVLQRRASSGDGLRVTRARKASNVKFNKYKKIRKSLRAGQGSTNQSKTKKTPIRMGAENEEPADKTDDIDAEYRFQDYDPKPQEDYSEQTGNVGPEKSHEMTGQLAENVESSYENRGPKVVHIQSKEKDNKVIAMNDQMFEQPMFPSKHQDQKNYNTFIDEEDNEQLDYGKKLIGYNPNVVPHDPRDEVENMPDTDASNTKHFAPKSNEKSQQYAGFTDEDSNESKTTFDVTLEMEDGMFNETEQVDLMEYAAECPTACPARSVMVCARCQHDVYKTFMSICHMRMFACHHTDELLELVSRYPCVMSAPYLSEDPPMQPRGILSEQGDGDRILRYIHCREQGKLIKDQNHLAKIKIMDPKCDFIDDNKLKHEVYFSDIFDYY